LVHNRLIQHHHHHHHLLLLLAEDISVSISAAIDEGFVPNRQSESMKKPVFF